MYTECRIYCMSCTLCLPRVPTRATYIESLGSSIYLNLTYCVILILMYVYSIQYENKYVNTLYLFQFQKYLHETLKTVILIHYATYSNNNFMYNNVLNK